MSDHTITTLALCIGNGIWSVACIVIGYQLGKRRDSPPTPLLPQKKSPEPTSYEDDWEKQMSTEYEEERRETL